MTFFKENQNKYIKDTKFYLKPSLFYESDTHRIMVYNHFFTI